MRSTLLIAMLATASLAGCTTIPLSDSALPPDTTRPAGGDGFAPQSGHQEASNDRFSLVGDLTVEDCDTSFCIHAVATNEGGDDLYVHDICITSWSESMKQRESQVQKSESEAHCEAFGLRAMEPNEQMEMDFTWDGKLWDEDAQEYRDAPGDTYTWSIHFQYFEDAQGGDSTTVTIDFPVIIGET